MARFPRAALSALAALLFAGSALADEVAAPTAPPAALPQIEDAGLRAEAERARDELVAAKERVTRADATYTQMRSRDYPRGDARAAIVRERDDARAEYLRASAAYSEILQRLQDGE